jgi:CyaY protein
MTETQFLALVDVWFLRIEDALEGSPLDVDCARQGKVLTVEFENRAQIIINAQPAIQELWLASQLGAYHFRWRDSHWADTRTGDDFANVLQRDVAQLNGLDPAQFRLGLTPT